jgi:uncharacterized protein DUF4043
MATTQTPADLIEIRYRRDYWREYVRTSGFMPYMGGNADGVKSIIHAAMEPTASGKSVTIPLVSSLRGGGVRGNTRLSGNEEALGKHTHAVAVQTARHGVELSEQDEHYDFSNAREAVRPLLQEWSRCLLRDRIIDAFGTVAYSFSSAPQCSTFFTPLNSAENVLSDATANNAWAVRNLDRVLYGSVKSNYSGVHATDLAKIDNTDDKLDTDLVSLLKEIAKDTSTNAKTNGTPAIRPVMDQYSESGREYFVLFTGSRPFRDLKTSTAMQQANRDARAREGNGMDKNPIFQDGDLIWDGVIIREIPEIPVLAGAGLAGIDVAPVFLCGCQAVSVAWGAMPDFRKKNEDDYGHFDGIAIRELAGANKIMRKDGVSGTQVDNGLVTGFVAAVAST